MKMPLGWSVGQGVLLSVFIRYALHTRSNLLKTICMIKNLQIRRKVSLFTMGIGIVKRLESCAQWFYNPVEIHLELSASLITPPRTSKPASVTWDPYHGHIGTSMAVVMVNRWCSDQSLVGFRFQSSQHHLLWCVTPKRCRLIACLDSLSFPPY